MNVRHGRSWARACARLIGIAAQLLLFAGWTGAAAQSGTPSIEFVTPASNATFSSLATIPIQVNVNDPTGTIAKVEFRANDFRGQGYYYPGALISTDSSPPYAATWRSVTASTHKITAIGQTSGGSFVTSTSISVLVTGNPNIKPGLRILEPVQNSVAVSNSSVTFNVDAWDNDGSIDCVRFNVLTFMGPDYIGQDCTAPYRFTWSPGNGTYEVQAQAIDNVGHSSSKTVEFAIGNYRPSVQITSPADGAQYNAGQSFVVKAQATDSDGSIAKVEFWSQVDGILYGTDTTAPYEQTLTMPQPNEGMSVIAIAYDNQGASRESNRVRINSAGPPPSSIEITSPYSGASFAAGGTLPITTATSDPGNQIQRVEFSAHSTTQTLDLGTDTTAPYSIQWSNLPAGTWGINATAHLPNGSTQGALQITISVFAQNSPPSITLTSPSDGASYTEPATVLLKATASDADGTISKVEFLVDGGLLATDLAPPYELQWAGVKANDPRLPYRIRAVAYDNQGASTSTPTHSISVQPEPQPPQVALQSPTSGQVFVAPTAILLKAAAADADGTIARVEFYSGTQLLGSDTTAPYEWNWSLVPVGNYSFTAKAFDNSGMSATTDVVPVSVVAAPPEVIHFYHSDAQGSIVAVSDAAGQRVTSTNYRPFGQIAAGTGENSPTRLGYTGKLRDTDLDLSYFGARFYDPVYGRFVGLDPVDFRAGDLQSFGRYAYANNNPFLFVDPDGRQVSTAPWRWAYARETVPQAMAEGAGEVAIMAAKRGTTFAIGMVLCQCDLDARNEPGNDAIEATGSPVEFLFGGGIRSGTGKVARTASTSTARAVIGGCCCFPAGTLVLTAEGQLPIETLKVGQLVQSADTTTGKTELKPITNIITTEGKFLYSVHYTDGQGLSGKVETTDNHPFWVADTGWVETKDLLPGMQLASAEGLVHTVTEVTSSARSERTYNLTVADNSTYFAGDSNILVHNCTCFLKEAVIEKILTGNRVGSGLKDDAGHRAASYLSREQLDKGTLFKIIGGDKVERALFQVEEKFNEKAGIFEWILDPSGNITHQRFIEDGILMPIANQKLSDRLRFQKP